MGRVERFFQPNPLWWVKKNPTQPNSRGSAWVRQIFLIIIIKLRIRTTPLQVRTNL